MNVKTTRPGANYSAVTQRFGGGKMLSEAELEIRRRRMNLLSLIKSNGCALCDGSIHLSTAKGDRIGCARQVRGTEGGFDVSACRVPELYAGVSDGDITELTNDQVWDAMPPALRKALGIPYVDLSEIVADDDMKPVNETLPEDPTVSDQV